MRPEELRIGIWINTPDKGDHQVQDGIEIHLLEGNPPNPIPLTEEWLLKFGFEKQQDGDLTIYPGKNCYAFSEQWIHNGYPTSDSNALMKCKYVHQLQNLFFALTGEELTIKE
jgi:hypothetical protein